MAVASAGAVAVVAGLTGVAVRVAGVVGVGLLQAAISRQRKTTAGNQRISDRGLGWLESGRIKRPLGAPLSLHHR